MISVIIPTYNESENILNICGMISDVLTDLGEPFEVLVMDDDSPDRTSDIVNKSGIPHVRSINRKGQVRGLSAAVIDGFEAVKGDKIAVMDADLSHPPELLKKMADALNHAGIQLAVGSRYVRGGGSEGWPAHRVMASKAASMIAWPIAHVHDATSGFFMVKKTAIDGVKFDSRGFKIGLETFVKARHDGKIIEIPFIFRDRQAGESKLSGGVILDYFKQLFQLYIETIFRKTDHSKK